VLELREHSQRDGPGLLSGITILWGRALLARRTAPAPLSMGDGGKEGAPAQRQAPAAMGRIRQRGPSHVGPRMMANTPSRTGKPMQRTPGRSLAGVLLACLLCCANEQHASGAGVGGSLFGGGREDLRKSRGTSLQLRGGGLFDDEGGTQGSWGGSVGAENAKAPAIPSNLGNAGQAPWTRGMEHESAREKLSAQGELSQPGLSDVTPLSNEERPLKSGRRWPQVGQLFLGYFPEFAFSQSVGRPPVDFGGECVADPDTRTVFHGNLGSMRGEF